MKQSELKRTPNADYWYGYVNEEYRAGTRPERRPKSKGNPNPLTRWVGRIFPADAAPDAEPLVEIWGDTHWDVNPAVVAQLKEMSR